MLAGAARQGSAPRRRRAAIAPLGAVAALALMAACGQTPPGPPFVDVAARVGLDFVHANGMSGRRYIVEMMGAGAALLDYDGDGDLDLYLRQGEELPAGAAAASAAHGDRLFRNDLVPEGGSGSAFRLVDVSARAGIGAFGYGMGVATGDLDNDGAVDLYLTNFGPNRMLRNRGDGSFADETSRAGVEEARWSVPALFADFDRDGWLDLYVGTYLDFQLAGSQDCRRADSLPDYCGPLTYRPLSPRLFRNLGDGTFGDVGVASGVARLAGKALGAVAIDVELDGWPDLFVANDGQENFLWHNQGDGTFVEEAALLGCAVNAAGLSEGNMGVVVGDGDGDGDEDLFVTHLNTETNTLYRNEDGTFRDVTPASGLGPPSLPFNGFGTSWIDYDADGRLDLVTVNGEVRIIVEQMRAGDPLPLRQRKQLFRNRGDGTFEETSGAAGAAFVQATVGRAAATGDLENDGDTDLLVTSNNGPAELLASQVPPGRPWIGLRLLVAPGGRDALGTRVVIHRRGAPALHRWVRTDGSYVAANDPRIAAALGEAPEVERLAVRWPSGRAREYWLPPRDVYLTLYEETPGILEGSR